MNTRTVLIRIFTAAFVALVLLLATFTFQVQQYENVMLTRFGKPQQLIKEPGLYFRWPWPITSVERIDTRLDVFEMRIAETITQDKRNVILPLFVAWKIADPQRYLEAIGTAGNARDRLDSLISNAKNLVIGQYRFDQLISSDPEQVKLSEIQQEILQQVQPTILNDYGIQVDTVGILRVALPESNTAAVFDRMRAERAKVAAQLRAEGKQIADKVRADADTARSVELARAKSNAAKDIGLGEREAARIYREAYDKNPELYEFLQELESLEKITGSRTRVVLDSSIVPFQHMESNANP
jgi:membrane protease subunit HflC